jgi:hypothetical protein
VYEKVFYLEISKFMLTFVKNFLIHLVGRFKGLEIVSEEHQDINEITINLKYDAWDKNVL